MANKEFMWSHLVHLGSNCWNDVGNTKGREHRSTPCASEKLLFNRELWDAHMKDLRDIGVNTLIVDVADAMVFESHPELAVSGSWSHDRMRAEVERLKALGFEVVPKLNFSAAHDAWLKEYSRMLSTSIYYQVCADIIKEVCDVFKPKYFHIGMDEETAGHQKNFDFVAIRQFDLWWKDLYFLVNCVEREGVRAWVWSDYIWNHEEEFLRKMPKSVVQTNWYYGDVFDVSQMEERRQIYVRAFDILSEQGYDQVPAGSVWSKYENFELLTKYCTEHISSESLMGLMQTSWERVAGPWMYRQKEAVDTIAAAKAWYDAR
jgi:hypothetical protein